MRFAALGRDALIYGLATLLVRGQQIFLIPIYTRYLGSNDYGVIETMTIVAALANVVVAFEISQGMARYVADAPDDESRKRYARTAITFGSICYFLFWLAIAVVSAPVSTQLFDAHAGSGTLLVAVAAIALNGVFMLVQELLRWQLNPLAYFVASFLYTVGGAAIGAWLVVSENIGVSGVFWGQLAGALAGMLVAARAAGALFGIELDRAALVRMLRFSLPLVISSVTIFASTFIDRVVVRELLGLDALGVYGVAARFASTVAILTLGLQIALSPRIYRAWRESETGSKLAQVFRYYCVGMVPIIGCLALYAGEILSLLAGPAFQGGRVVLPILALGSMLISLYVFSPGVFLGERTNQAAVLSLGGAGINLILCLLLTETLGMPGAAIAAVAAAALVFAGHVLLGRKYFHIPFDFRCMTVTAAILVAMVALGGMFGEHASLFDWPTVVLKGALICVCFILAIFYGLRHDDRAAATRIFKRNIFKWASKGE